jgi:YD repeat-containing protein
MSSKKIQEILIFKKEILLKSAHQNHLEEHEYLFSRSTYTHSGKVASEIHYSPDGKINQEYKFAYDDKGFLLEEILLEDGGFVADHKKYDMNNTGKIEKEYRYYSDGSFDTIEYVYNDKGQVVKSTTIDPDGEIEHIEEFEYESDLLVHYKAFDGEGDLISEKKTTYDEKGNPVEWLESDALEGTSLRIEAEYYPSGNKKQTLVWNEDDELIEKTLLTEDVNGRLAEVVEENANRKNTIRYEYDTEGNIIKQEEFDKKNNLVSSVSRVFAPGHQLISSDVFIDGAGRGLSKNYSLRHEYVYFE